MALIASAQLTILNKEDEQDRNIRPAAYVLCTEYLRGHYY
jgi:hypothetical protein